MRTNFAHAAVMACVGLSVLGCPSITPDLDPQLDHEELLRADLIQRLEQRSETAPEITWVDGVPAGTTVRVPPRGGLDDPIDAALAYLDEYEDLYGLANPFDHLYLKSERTSRGRTHLYFGQYFDGIPVFGATIAVHLRDRVVEHTNGRYLAEAPAPSTTRISNARAIDLAKAALGRPDASWVGAAVETWFARSLLSSSDELPRIAWQVALRTSSPPGQWTVFVDADSERILQIIDEFRTHPTTRSFQLRDADGTAWGGCSLASFPEIDPSVTLVADRIRTANAATYDFFHRQAEVHSWDDTGLVSSGFRYSDETAFFAPWCNATYFGSGFGVDDVIAHEFTHGFIQATSDLIYADEPGALNESYADIVGVMVDDEDWLLGEDTILGAIRSVANPDSLTTRSGIPYPEHVDEYRDIPGDNGGVHFNSSIINYAHYLMATGLGVAPPMGRDRVAALALEAMATLPENASFANARIRSLQIALDFVDDGFAGFRPVDVCTVMDSFAQVGLGVSCEDNDLDRDGDHVIDWEDNCADVFNTWQHDLDDDGEGDACDDDRDGDGVPEDGDLSGLWGDTLCSPGRLFGCDDNCPSTPNADQSNTDGDQRGDACDDSDFDLVDDDRDNCPHHENRDQLDQDGDRCGDVCDRDFDGDGVLDRPLRAGEDPADFCGGVEDEETIDNCVVPWDLDSSTNPDQIDSDGDGFGDRCDGCPDEPNESLFDFDDDGTPDDCDPDDDNDGIPDASDSCPYTNISSPFDIDGDGIDAACDDDEQLDLSGELAYFVRDIEDLLEWFRIPTGPCTPNGCAEYSPEGLFGSIRMTTDAPLRLSLVDHRGFIVEPPGRSSDFELSLPRTLPLVFDSDGGRAYAPFAPLFLQIEPLEGALTDYSDNRIGLEFLFQGPGE